MRDKSKLAVCASVTLVALAIPSAARAEGSFRSYMTNVRDSFDSRTWTDHNSDTVSTHITLSGVTKAGFCLQLTRERPWYLPDESRGVRDLGWGGTAYWGRQPAGDYHFTDVSDTCGGYSGWTNSGQTHSASYVGVWY